MKKGISLIILLACSVANAYRDTETGTFLTRDPIGYQDGPNLYCYVHCNPITQFDAWGLSVSSTTTENEDGSTETEYEIEAEVVFEDDRLNEMNEDGTYKYQDDRDQYVQNIKDSLMETYNGQQGNHSWSMSEDNLKVSVASSAADVKENNHMIIVTSADKMPQRNPDSGYAPPAVAERGGGAMWINTSTADSRTPSHESIHWFGSKDTADPYNANITWQSRYTDSMELNSKVADQLQSYVDQPGAVNNNLGPRAQTEKIIDPENRSALRAADPKPERPRVY